jgi:murein DD-endopeptidase MepM/ murein hydrolase activator NlpD
MPAAESITAAPAASPAPSSEPAKPDATASADAPKVLNSAPNEPAATSAQAPAQIPAQADQKVAALDTKTATDANPAADSKPAEDKSVSSSGRLRWPVQGRIISAFGPRPDGTHNDGVNFSVPQGTDVHAAEGGEVIYVGDELKAYGKLVLLRHDNGWVTAYAHNEDLLVTRGKKVARGDVIAKAGKTGPVDQPQVHFELRQDSKAVDPTSFMEKQ